MPDKIPDTYSLKEERFNLGLSFRRFGPWPAGSKAGQKGTMEQNYSPRGGQKEGRVTAPEKNRPGGR